MKHIKDLIRQVFANEHIHNFKNYDSDNSSLSQESPNEILEENENISKNDSQNNYKNYIEGSSPNPSQSEKEITQTNQAQTNSSDIQSSSLSSNLSDPENLSKDTPMPSIPTDPKLLELYHECKSCRACELCTTAQNLVFGDGSPTADIMIIGEAPGADEDEQGIPFVGRAGQLLIKILAQHGIERSDIFIANILKHRPPANRNPLSAEIEACTPFLQKQIEIVKPKLLITLGNFSSRYILNTKEGITSIRGKITQSSYGMVMPTLHPSAIIRGAYPMEFLEEDIKTALAYIKDQLS